MKNMNRTLKISLKIVLGVILIGTITFVMFQIGRGNVLKELENGIRKYHPDPFVEISEEEFNAAFDELKQSWKELGAVEDGRYYAMRKLVASIGDEHTHLAPSVLKSQPELPFFVISYEGNWMVVQAQKEYSQIVGKKLTAVNGVEVEELRSMLLPLISCETEGWAEYQCSLEFRYLRNLRYIGVTDTLEKVEITVEDFRTGEQETLEVEARRKGYDYGNASMYNAIAPTLVQSGYYRAELISGMLFIQYNICEEASDLSMEEFVQALKTQLADTIPQKILVDMRHNTGGNSNVISPLLEMLEEYVGKGSALYCLTGGETFSSGVLNVLDLKDIGACIVGETTGGVTGFGELKTVRLSDGSRLYCSSKDFSQYYGSHEPVTPDIQVVQTVEDFLNGIDSAVTYIQDL